jgi:head-tail adaptor
MEPGRFRHRVTVQNSRTIRSPSGQPKAEWYDAAVSVPAETKAISGRELVASGGESRGDYSRLDAIPADVTAASRLVVLNGPFKGLTLEVVGPPIPDAKSTRLEILCKQGVYRD